MARVVEVQRWRAPAWIIAGLAATAFMANWGGPEDGFARWKARYRRELKEAQRYS